jgi:uncharacterized Fe-S cluster protein YjdI
MPDQPARKGYASDDITVTFDTTLCEHSGNCVRGLPAVFDASRRPWIQPANAPGAEVADAVRRCPSGALQYELRGDAAERG